MKAFSLKGELTKRMKSAKEAYRVFRQDGYASHATRALGEAEAYYESIRLVNRYNRYQKERKRE